MQRAVSRSRELKVTQELDDAATGRGEPGEDSAGWEGVSRWDGGCRMQMGSTRGTAAVGGEGEQEPSPPWERTGRNWGA